MKKNIKCARLFAGFIILLSLAALMSSCATQATSTIVGCNYKADKDVTHYFVFPYGEVELPGKWEKKNYNQVSRQQFFDNQEDVSIAIVFGPANKYEFNQNGTLRGYDFANAFYEWESKYFEANGIKSQIIEADKENGFVLFRLFGQYSDKEVDTYMLIREKNGVINSFSIYSAPKWDENQKVAFLKSLLK